MQEHTRFRLAMLQNGFRPTLNDCKRAVEKGWPTKRISENEVLGWDRSLYTSTGMVVDGDLAVVDADIADQPLMDALAAKMQAAYPELFTRGLIRHAGGVKEAWIVRTAEPFRRLASHRWYAPGQDPDDKVTTKHLVECFGSLGSRQFGIDGPHSRGPRGELLAVYEFVGGASPANTPRAELPVLPRVAFVEACNRFDELAAGAGLLAVKVRRDGAGEMTPRIFELESGTKVETADFGVMTVAELERFVKARRAGANAPSTLRCSGTFHDPTRVRTDSHLINWGRHGLGIYDCMTESTWHRRERAPSATFEFLAQLRERTFK
jgi:hypothetical protein